MPLSCGWNDMSAAFTSYEGDGRAGIARSRKGTRASATPPAPPPDDSTAAASYHSYHPSRQCDRSAGAPRARPGFATSVMRGSRIMGDGASERDVGVIALQLGCFGDGPGQLAARLV